MEGHKEDLATEKLAADTILHRGVKLKIAAPWFIRWAKKTWSVRITTPYEGTMHRVSAYYLSTGLKDADLESPTVEESLALMAMHGKTISTAVAVAILNGYWSGKLFARPLAWYLRWHCKSKELLAITSILLLYGGVQDFMGITRLVRRMKTTTPNLGQQTKGS